MNAAQYQVASGWTGLCGLIALAAILGVPVSQTSAIITEFKRITGLSDPNYQTGPQLAALVNATNEGKWTATYQRDSDYSTSYRARHRLQGVLSEGYALPLLEIVSGSRKYEVGGQVGETLRASDGCNGTPGSKICHWVVITGTSRQGDASRSESYWNWVRIYNPFDNTTEYYRWEDFRAAWHAALGRYAEVVLRSVQRPGGETEAP